MACGCNKGVSNANIGGDTLGYRAILPNGEAVPPRDEVPFFMAAEAMRHVTLERGGTVLRIRKTDQDDAYALSVVAAEAEAKSA